MWNLFVAVAWANPPQTVEREQPVSPNLHVSVSMTCGSVALTGSELAVVKISGTIDRADTLDVETAPGAVEIDVLPPACAHLAVRVPRAAALDVETMSAPVTVRGVHGPLAIESVTGNLSVEGDCAELEAETISGAISATGAIRRASLSTVSGGVTADGLSGSVGIETISGAVRFAGGAPIDVLLAETVSGPITAAAHLAPRARVELESHSGPVVLAFPAASQATVHAESATGRIASAYGATGGRSLHTTLGAGTGVVVVETFSGPITLTRLEAPLP